MHSSILDIKIDYSFILSDHHSLVFVINQNTIPISISYNNCIIHKKIQWNRLDKKQIFKYNIDTKFNLGKLINDIYSFDSNINRIINMALKKILVLKYVCLPLSNI